jgi:hypothetical protein
MPIMSKKPYVDANGDVYPFLTVSFNSRADVQERYVGAPTIINMHPFRILQDGTYVLAPQEAMRTFIMADAFKAAARDPELAGPLMTMFQAIGALIDVKEL